MEDIQAFIDEVFEKQYTKQFGFARTPKTTSQLVNLTRYQDERLVAVLQAKCVLDNAHITALVVDEAYQGQKLGTSLLQEFETWAQEQGLSSITLSTKSYQAEGFYIKLGYEPYARLENLPQEGVVKYHLIKRLSLQK